MAVTAESNLAKKLDKTQTKITFSEEELKSYVDQ